MPSSPIIPNSTVWLLRGVPLDNTYENTLYFPSRQAQIESILRPVTDPDGSFIIKTYNNQMYKRMNASAIRVNSPIEELYDCNYMVFLNDKFGTAKYFFAFVNEINYISNFVTEIVFELDVMQTWLFGIDYDPSQCIVEREHTITDNWQEHIISEDLKVGEYLLEEFPEPEVPNYYVDPNGTTVKAFTDLGIFVSATAMPEGLYIATPDNIEDLGPLFNRIPMEKPKVVPYGGVLNGLYTQQFIKQVGEDAAGKRDYITRLNFYLNSMDEAGYSDGVVNIFMAPVAFWTRPNAYNQATYVWDEPYSFEMLTNQKRTFTDIDGSTYVPKNNKCCTYPYCYYFFMSSDGESEIYKYDRFNPLPGGYYPISNTFEVTGVITSDCTLRVAPKNYGGITGENWTEALYCNNTPILPWSSDVYKCWLAQHKASLAGGVLQTDISGAAGVLTGASMGFMMGGPAGAVIGATLPALRTTTSLLNKSVGVLASMEQAKHMPNKAHGDVGGQIYVATDTYGFKFYNCYAKIEYIKTIDNFFTRFGYKVNKMKIPTINNRPHFTYVKTVGFDMHNNWLPSNVSKKICEIFDKGVTFWNNILEVGEFDLDNRPLVH